jgi:flagellin
MRINSNIAGMNAQQINSNTESKMAKSLEKLASGQSINRAADDAAGLSIADKLKTQGNSINQGIKNANSGVAMIQMADKAMEEQANILDTVKTKLIQAATDSTTDDGRASLQSDINKLLTQFDNIAEQTNYNGNNLLDAPKELNFQVGEHANEDITAKMERASNTESLGGSSATTVGDAAIRGNDATSINYGDSMTVTQKNSATAVAIDMSNVSSGTATPTAITATNGVILSGDVKEIKANGASVQLVANDAETRALLDAMVASSASNITASGTAGDPDRVYQIQADEAINFQDGSKINVTIIDTAVDGLYVKAQDDKAFNIDATNVDSANMITLGNASEAITGGQVVTKIDAEASQTLAGGENAITLKGLDTATGSAESITDTRIEGTIQTISNGSAAAGSMTFVANDAETIALMDSIAINNVALTASGSAGDADRTYTLIGASGTDIDLGNAQIDITIKSSDTAGLNIKAENESIEVTQGRDDQGLGVTNALDGIGKGSGGSLSDLAAEKTLTKDVANEYMKTIDTALLQLSENRSELGSTQNQLESSVRNNQATVVSLKNAESIIRDTDYAAESANFNKQKIIAQAGMYALSQANAMQQNVQKLLQ